MRKFLNRARKFPLVIIGLILLGFALRTTNLSSNPVGFFCDEASIGYNAYTILTRGQDEYGVRFPLFFQAFGEYKSPIQTYATVPFIALFGLNELATRLPSVLFGTLTIPLLYLQTVEFCKRTSLEKGYSRTAGLLAALFLAISPWHIHFSRIGFEMTPFVFFTSAALYTALKGKSILTALFLSLAAYSYFPARIFIPLFSVPLFLFFWKGMGFLHTLRVGLIFTLLCLPLVLHVLFGPGIERFKQVSIFEKKDLTREEQYRHIGQTYLAHFSPAFLFTKGDIDFPGQFITRHSVRGLGQLYIWQAPFILLGLGAIVFTLFQRKRPDMSVLLLIWLGLYPLGSVFTQDAGPQATRSIIGVVPFQILTAVGMVFAFSLLTQLVHFLRLPIRALRIVQSGYIAVITAIIITAFASYIPLYFVQYPRYSADFWGWQMGPKEIISYFKQHQDEYDELFMEGAFNAPDIFFKFYDPTHECTKCRLGIPEQDYIPGKKQLFAVTPYTLSTLTTLSSKKHMVYYPDGTVAFYLVTNK